MKTAGMFTELGPVKQTAPQPSIRDNVGSAPLPDADRVVAYLNAGHDLIAMMDVQDDFFDPSRQVLGGSSVRTDGEWLWRDDLSYYVRRHDVMIPDEFLESIRQRHYVVPDLDDETLDKCADEAERMMF